MRMIDIEIMLKALKLAWIPRILSSGRQNWRTVPDYYLRKLGGLNFLLKCNYDPTHLNFLPSFYQSILFYYPTLLRRVQITREASTNYHTIFVLVSFPRPRERFKTWASQNFGETKTFFTHHLYFDSPLGLAKILHDS